MKLIDVVTQLHAVMPSQTNLFTTTTNIGSMTRSGSTVTVGTTGCHDLSTGELVSIVGATEPINIDSLTRLGNVATAITATDTDLTPNYQKQVVISGAIESEYNGTKDFTRANEVRISGASRIGYVVTVQTFSEHGLIANPYLKVLVTGFDQQGYNGTFVVESAPTSSSFTYTITTKPVTPATGYVPTVEARRSKRVFFFQVDNEPSSPATGTIALEQPQFLNNGYNGMYTVTVIDGLTFTYQITTTPQSPALGTKVVHSCPRISGAVDIEEAIKAYTKQADQDLWAFVVIDSESTSKDRHTTDDSTATLSKGSVDYRLVEVTGFSVYVIAPATEEVAGENAVDLIRGTVKPAIYKSLLNINLPTYLSTEAMGAVVPTSNGIWAYIGAYYTHRFQFEMVSEIVFDDGVDPDYNTAFRCINMETRNSLKPVLFNDTFNIGD